jgi:hemerythrin-like metal-binding protein
MTQLEFDPRWVRTFGTHRQSLLSQAQKIHILQNQNSKGAALDAEHAAIEMLLQAIWTGVVAGAERADIIECLNSAIDFCATHFKDEEETLRRLGAPDLEVHAAEHNLLLTNIVAARRQAAGEGLSLGVLDAGHMLQAFHEHVDKFDKLQPL